jgi:hypothetical protein
MGQPPTRGQPAGATGAGAFISSGLCLFLFFRLRRATKSKPGPRRARLHAASLQPALTQRATGCTPLLTLTSIRGRARGLQDSLRGP